MRRGSNLLRGSYTRISRCRRCRRFLRACSCGARLLMRRIVYVLLPGPIGGRGDIFYDKMSHVLIFLVD